MSDKQDDLDRTLLRLASVLPRREVDLVISEAEACELELLKEIAVLEAAASNKKKKLSAEDEATLEGILDSNLTPMDSCWTLSALLGRLRGEFMPPSILTAQDGSILQHPSKAATTSLDATWILDLETNPEYTREHTDTQKLLSTWKKIHQHRASFVFKKPVRDEDAPNYSLKVRFPMDLSMIRRLIVSKHVKSYQQLHRYMGLVAHNCVKYNGRQTEYGIIARDFEKMVDETIRTALRASATPTPVLSGA